MEVRLLIKGTRKAPMTESGKLRALCYLYANSFYDFIISYYNDRIGCLAPNLLNELISFSIFFAGTKW